jgi:hypothetical protein
MAKHIPHFPTILQKAVKYNNIVHSKSLQKYTQIGMFWFENIYYLATLGGSANPSRAFSQTEIASNQKKNREKTKTKN